MTDLISPTLTFSPDQDIIRHDQYISDDFLRECQEARDASQFRSNNYHKVASIPTAVVEKWQREGFNIFDADVTAAQIVKRLTDEDLGVFITTTKRV